MVFVSLVSQLIIVLYSCQHHTWKIADFGIATEGTSKHSQTTRYSRGTTSYRAPELIIDGKFTNKVDIWSAGCILYEVIFKQKLFASDYAVYDYVHKFRNSKERLQFPFELAICQEGSFRTSMEDLVCKMLELDALLRPSAADLLSSLAKASWNKSGVNTEELLHDSMLSTIWL